MIYLTKLKIRNDCCVQKNQGGKRYGLIQCTIWMLAISTMAILACKDAIALFKQYNMSVPVTNVNIRDDSENGIRLPNATMCVEFNPSKEYADMNVTEFDYQNFDQSQLREAVQFSRIVLNYAEQQTLRRNTSWDSVVAQLTVSNVNLSSVKGDQLLNFSRILAGHLCRLMDVKVRLIMGKETNEGYNVCEWVRTGILPFTVNSDTLFCFRVPLDLMAMVKDKLKHDYTGETIDGYNWKHQRILLEFKPLQLRKTFHKPDGDDELLNTVIFLPEIPFSYTENVKRKLADLPQTRFVHTLSFNKLYGLNYFRQTNVKVEFYISAKYNRLTDKKDCLDIFHETNCYARCMERDFRQICHCDRYIFRHFSRDDHDDVHRLCTSRDYAECFDRYQTYASALSSRDRHLLSCMQTCTKCAAVNLEWQTKEFTKNWLRTQNHKDLKMLCELLNLILNNLNVTTIAVGRPTYCRDLLDNVGDYIPYIFNVQNNNYRNRDDVVTTDGRKFFRALLPTVSSLFGTVAYEFSMKSFKYPEYGERTPITKEGFLSQIGGILNLYLGISGMTCFTLLLAGVRFAKRRRQKRRELVQRQSQNTMSMLHAWHVLSREYLNNKIRTVRWMMGQQINNICNNNHNNNQITVITIT